ncbi:FlaD/FlaE family flagellar protein [Methanosarcina sp. Mfa9]|uniref:FlaD/FlaE family flagellar protein n=1 Tax=Methanosarcina sp. Mfa9 TaxID=3439063 RepID=UPI003F833D95
MELDKRVTGLETEFKILKGEMRELLVDIRDQMNRTDNPFCGIQSQGAPKIEAAKKEVPVEGENAEEKVPKEGFESPSTVQGNSQADKDRKKRIEGNQDAINQDAIQPAWESVKQEGKTPVIPAQELEVSGQKEIDTPMIVELMRWVDYAVRTVGHSNLDELLNLYNVTGHLSDELKGVLQNIANLSIEEPAEESRVSMKENIVVLSHLSAILNPGKSGGRIQPIYGETGWEGEKKDKKTELAFN